MSISFLLVRILILLQHVHQNTYRLHAILLSRSPYLAQILQHAQHSGGDRIIVVPLEHEPEITPEVRHAVIPRGLNWSLTVLLL
jgi:hypothetical protein